MRQELKEYNYDWMLWRTINPGSRLADGSAKELAFSYRYIPYFKGILKTILDQGPSGRLFLKMLDQYFENIILAKERGQKLAMTTFCFCPAICYALDTIPICLEVLTAIGAMMWKRGNFDYLDHTLELGFTETACSSQRGALGAYLSGLTQEIDFIVCDSAGICDTNANSYSFTASYLHKPFFQLNYPQTLGDSQTNDYHLQDYLALIDFMEQQTGKKLDQDRLRKILREIAKQDSLLLELEDLHRLKPNPVPSIFNLFTYCGRFIFSGQPMYTRLLKTMLHQAQENASKGKSGNSSGSEKLRVLMCYIDHYTLNLNFFHWLDKKGISQAGSILSFSFREQAPYAELLPGATYSLNDKDLPAMLNSLAQLNARMPMVRSIRGPFDQPNMWLEENLAAAKVFDINVIIYNGTPGCRNTWGMVKPFARELEKHGYPVHIMYTDAFDDRMESWEATRERLDEFFNVRGLL